MIASPIVKQYSADLPKLSQAQASLDLRLRALLLSGEFDIHSLTGRIKSTESLARKVARPDKTYRSLYDVTDLIAFRAVTFFEATIGEVARAIEGAFQIDMQHSVNKLRSNGGDRFGYRSLHYVCSLPEDVACELPRQARFEIQVRTILQHAWAEIEHDLGYKSSTALPSHLRRRFSQVAGLLEVADREFGAIRSELITYADALREPCARESENSTELDRISLLAALERDEAVALDSAVAHALDVPLSNDRFFPDYVVTALRAAGFGTAGEALEFAGSRRADIAAFCTPYFRFARAAWGLEPSSLQRVERGYGLLFAAHLRAYENDSLVIDKVATLSRFYAELDRIQDAEATGRLARMLVEEVRASTLGV